MVSLTHCRHPYQLHPPAEWLQNYRPPSNLVFTGFQGILDPPRPGVEAAIAKLTSGGVKVVMITGDSEATARSIAVQLGILISGSSRDSISFALSAPNSPILSSSHPSVLTGREIDTMSQRQLTDRIESVSVFARTTPRHKMAIVEAFQSKGKIVAMTGDGGQPLTCPFLFSTLTIGQSMMRRP